MNLGQTQNSGYSPLFCIVVWGVTFVSTKVLLEYLTPAQILFTRFLLGYMALWLMYPRLSPKYGRKVEFLFALAGFLGTFVYFFMENVALQYSTASNVGVLICLSPFFTGVLSKIENPSSELSKKFFVGVTISFIGVFLIMLGGTEELTFNPLGDPLAVGAGFVWACYSITLKKLSVYEIPILLSTRTIFGYGLIFIFLGLLLLQEPIALETFKHVEVWSNLAFLGFIASAACYAMWTGAVEKIGASSATIYVYLIPVICLICAYIVLDEKLTMWSGNGTLLVLCGLVISQLDFSSAKEKLFKAKS